MCELLLYIWSYRPLSLFAPIRYARFYIVLAAAVILATGFAVPFSVISVVCHPDLRIALGSPNGHSYYTPMLSLVRRSPHHRPRWHLLVFPLHVVVVSFDEALAIL